jgi:nucleoside-diphosphate kinase
VIESTLIFLKPDAVEQRLEGVITYELESNGLRVIRRKELVLTDELAGAHYAHHSDKPFFPGLIRYVTRGPVVAMVIEGKHAVAAVRELIGATDPRKASPRTLRARFGRITADGSVENLIHASDHPNEAKIEIRRFFGPDRSWWSRWFGWLWSWRTAEKSLRGR